MPKYGMKCRGCPDKNNNRSARCKLGGSDSLSAFAFYKAHSWKGRATSINLTEDRIRRVERRRIVVIVVQKYVQGEEKFEQTSHLLKKAY